MQKVKMLRALTLPVASAFALAACAPQMATMAPVKTENAAASATANQAQPAMQVSAAGTVSGLVKSYNPASKQFEAVAGAVVKLDGTNLTATTDAEGRYQLSGVPAGAQNVTVTKAGFSTATGRLVANAVMGLTGVNLAMQRASYGLNAVGGRTLTVGGVVSDPRGIALAGASVTATASSGDITVDSVSKGASAVLTADEKGYYTFTVAGADANREVQVRLDVKGQTPGGVEVELSSTHLVQFLGNTGTSPVSSATAENIQCNAFPLPSAPTITSVTPTGTALIPGEIATIGVADNLSNRADEFFIRLHTNPEASASNLVSDELPLSVVKANGQATVTFQVPYSMGESSNVGIQICQLGIVPSQDALTASTGGGLGPLSGSQKVHAFSQSNYETAIGGDLDTEWSFDTSSFYGSRYNKYLSVNPGLIAAAGEVATASIGFGDGNASVPVQVEVSFELAAGLEVVGALLGTGTVDAEFTDGIAVPADKIASATGTGTNKKWTLTVLQPPNSDTTKKRRLEIGIRAAGTDSNAGGQIEFKDLKVYYPTRKWTVESTAIATLPLYTPKVEKADGGWELAKRLVAVTDDPNAYDVELVATPPANWAVQALQVVDFTPVGNNSDVKAIVLDTTDGSSVGASGFAGFVGQGGDAYATAAFKPFGDSGPEFQNAWTRSAAQRWSFDILDGTGWSASFPATAAYPSISDSADITLSGVKFNDAGKTVDASGQKVVAVPCVLIPPKGTLSNEADPYVQTMGGDYLSTNRAKALHFKYRLKGTTNFLDSDPTATSVTQLLGTAYKVTRSGSDSVPDWKTDTLGTADKQPRWEFPYSVIKPPVE